LPPVGYMINLMMARKESKHGVVPKLRYVKTAL